MSLITWLDKRPVLQCASISILLNLIVEILSRRSIVAGFGFLFSNPLLFLYNAAIIMLTLSFSLAIKRRYFALVIVSVIWTALGVTNFVLLGFRTTPLAAIDFQLLKSVDGIISMYLNLIHIVLIVVVGLSVVAGVVLAWKRSPQKKPLYLTAITALLAVTIFIASSTSFLVRARALSSDFGNLADAYIDYGFAYCFSRSLIDRGIDEPEDYSEENIVRLLQDIEAYETVEPDVKPNIIMVQLESFFDVNYLNEVSFSENPVPTFTMLKDSFPHGFLTVPSIGAGTANTEFEILTGMNLKHFGAGEYPYKTVLQDGTTESVAYNLAELGYTNHAIHNHEGTFYQRHVVFSNLGFNTYTSLEYMNDVEYNPIGWARDEVLTEEVMKALTSTTEQDFIYTISVQAHGKYPAEVIDEAQVITASGIEKEEERVALEYFVNQLHETDAFISALTTELATYKEPVVLVVFGDHLPGLHIENEDLHNADRFETEYVIWSNFDLEAPNLDLSASQLCAYVLEQLGITNGILTKFHQKYLQEDYLAALEMLEYDMVYGEQFAYGGESPHTATELHMGTAEIMVTGIQYEDEAVYVIGEGFTEWSQVFVDDKKVETLFVDGNILRISADVVKAGAEVAVAQIGDKTVLSKTDSYTCPGSSEDLSDARDADVRFLRPSDFPAPPQE